MIPPWATAAVRAWLPSLTSRGPRWPGGKVRSGSRRSRSDAVPVKIPPKRMLLPRVKGIYHVGCTDYPDPTYP